MEGFPDRCPRHPRGRCSFSAARGTRRRGSFRRVRRFSSEAEWQQDSTLRFNKNRPGWGGIDSDDRLEASFLEVTAHRVEESLGGLLGLVVFGCLAGTPGEQSPQHR
jgi:hypothetical protein